MAASAVASTEILNCVSGQVRESGRTYSNWFTQEKLRMQNVSRNLAFVRIALKSLVSEEIGIRSIKRFPRRKYTCVLLKHMWHIDDYYKLKPFHFATYGTIDGYSKKLLWLQAEPSNDHPRVVAPFCLDRISKLNITVPMTVRSDRGWKDVAITEIQQYFILNDSDCW